MSKEKFADKLVLPISFLPVYTAREFAAEVTILTNICACISHPRSNVQNVRQHSNVPITSHHICTEFTE